MLFYKPRLLRHLSSSKSINLFDRPGQVNRLIGKRVVSKYAYESIREVHKRRYLLQPIAVEVFCSDGQNQFLAFIKSVRPKVSLPLGSGCSTAVECTPRNREVACLNPAGCWANFSSQ